MRSLVPLAVTGFSVVHEEPIGNAGEVERILVVESSQYKSAAVTPYQSAHKTAYSIRFVYHFEHVSQWNNPLNLEQYR